MSIRKFIEQNTPISILWLAALLLFQIVLLKRKLRFSMSYAIRINGTEQSQKEYDYAGKIEFNPSSSEDLNYSGKKSHD